MKTVTLQPVGTLAKTFSHELNMQDLELCVKLIQLQLGEYTAVIHGCGKPAQTNTYP